MLCASILCPTNESNRSIESLRLSSSLKQSDHSTIITSSQLFNNPITDQSSTIIHDGGKISQLKLPNTTTQLKRQTNTNNVEKSSSRKCVNTIATRWFLFSSSLPVCLKVSHCTKESESTSKEANENFQGIFLNKIKGKSHQCFSFDILINTFFTFIDEKLNISSQTMIVNDATDNESIVTNQSLDQQQSSISGDNFVGPLIQMKPSVVSSQDMLSFEEWRSKISEQMEQENKMEIESKFAHEIGSKPDPVIDQLGSQKSVKITTNRARNFASHECGAKVVDSNSEANF